MRWQPVRAGDGVGRVRAARQWCRPGSMPFNRVFAPGRKEKSAWPCTGVHGQGGPRLDPAWRPRFVAQKVGVRMDLKGCGNVARGHVQRWTRYPHKRAEFQRVAAFVGTSRVTLPGCARCLCKDGRVSPIKRLIFNVLPLLWGRAGSRCPGALVAPAKMDALDVKNNHISRSCQHWHSGGNLVRRARPMNPGARQSPRQPI